MIRPALKNTVEARATPGAVWLLCGPDDDDLVIERHVDLVADLVRRLDGRRTTDELAAELATVAGHAGAEVRAAIAELADAGVLFDAAGLELLTPTVAQRAERHLQLLAADAGTAPNVAQQRLVDARVCLLGLGGFGCWMALGLASSGVGALVGVDFDRVERSNLNRQVLYGDGDIGRLKASVARREIRRRNADVAFDARPRRIDSADAVADVVAGCDLVVDTLDDPPHLANRWVSEACFGLGVPFMSISQQPPLIRVGPLYVPGRTGCFACVEEHERRRHPLLRLLERADRIARQRATSGPASAAAAALALHDVVRFLVRGDATTVGRAHAIDLRTLERTVDPVVARPDCVHCAAASTRRSRSR